MLQSASLVLTIVPLSPQRSMHLRSKRDGCLALRRLLINDPSESQQSISECFQGPVNEQYFSTELGFFRSALTDACRVLT